MEKEIYILQVTTILIYSFTWISFNFLLFLLLLGLDWALIHNVP